MSDVAAKEDTKKAPKDYGSMDKAGVVADFKNTVKADVFALRVTKGELAAAAATIAKGEVKLGPNDKQAAVDAIVTFSKAVSQGQWEQGADGKNQKVMKGDKQAVDKGVKGIQALEEGFGKQPTRVLQFDSTQALKIIEAAKSDEKARELLKVLDEGRKVSIPREIANNKARDNAKGKAAAGAEMGG